MALLKTEAKAGVGDTPVVLVDVRLLLHRRINAGWPRSEVCRIPATPGKILLTTLPYANGVRVEQAERKSGDLDMPNQC